MIKPIASCFIFFLFVSIIQSDESVKTGDLYDTGIGLYYKGNYEEAIEIFSSLIQKFPHSKLVPYSYYMIGMCLLKKGQYGEALKKFEYYLKMYPDGDRVNEVRQEIEVCREKLKIKEDLNTESSQPKNDKSPIEFDQDRIEVKKKEFLNSDRKVHGEVPITAKQSQEMKRRICTQVFYLDSRTLNEVERRIKELKKAGINTIIFRVFQNKGERTYKFLQHQNEAGVYFKTDYAPVVYDILGKISEISHRNGIDIFAWMTTRYADFGLETDPGYRCKGYNFETKRMEITRGYNLFHPEVLRRLEGIYRDLGRYQIDGILFQDDLILRHNEDFSIEANKAFLKEYGFSPNPDTFYIEPFKSDSGKYYVKAYTERFWKWANWKNRWLMDVAKRLMSAAKESNPKLQFGINLYYETILNHSNAIAWFSQNISRAIETNFDYYAIMLYHRQALKELNMERENAINLMVNVSQKAINLIRDPSRVLVKLQILDWQTYEVIPEREISDILSVILKQGEVSVAFVPYIQRFPLHLLKGKWSKTY